MRWRTARDLEQLPNAVAPLLRAWRNGNLAEVDDLLCDSFDSRIKHLDARLVERCPVLELGRDPLVR